MSGKIVFDDGYTGNLFYNGNLYLAHLSIIEKDGEKNLARIKFDKSGEIERSENLLPKSYSDIEVSKIRDSYLYYRGDTTVNEPELDGLVCTLPNGKKEVYYFLYQHLEKLFSEENDVKDFSQVYLLYGENVADTFYVLTHQNGLKSLVHRNIKKPSELEYISRNAHDIEVENAKAKICEMPNENGYVFLTYDFRKRKFIKDKKAKKPKKRGIFNIFSNKKTDEESNSKD